MSYKISDKRIATLATLLQQMNATYELYAKKVDLSYTGLQILNLISQLDNCTQKQLCDHTLLPKQTINTAISNFIKKDLIYLEIRADDRRSKAIYFTAKGKTLIDKVIPKIRQAESVAIESLATDQQTALLVGLDQYCSFFKATIQQEMTELEEEN